MNHGYPSDLARVVAERWDTFVTRQDATPPPLPSPTRLKELLEAVYFASLEREEGRDLLFSVCWANGGRILRDGTSDRVPFSPLLKPKTLTSEALRKLAPAISPQLSAIMVEPSKCTKEELVISGILHIGGHYARARAGKTFQYRPQPYALLIEVRGPGELHIYQGGYKLAFLKSGEIHQPLAVSTLDFLGVMEILHLGEKGLWPRITPPKHESDREWSDFQFIALLNVVLCVVNDIHSHGHGGTLILTAPEMERSLPIRLKYATEIDVNFLDQRFVEFINLRHQLADLIVARESQPEVKDEMTPLHSALHLAEEDLADAAATIAALSAVDGAVVLTSALRLAGFGAEIVLESAQATKVFEVAGETYMSRDWPGLDSEQFGMRHRSAVRLVAATESTAAFIVSQDGTASCCWKKDGKVYLKRGVNLSNPNMVGA